MRILVKKRKRRNSQLIIGYYCQWLSSLVSKLSIFDDDEGWDILPRAIKTLLRSILLRESVCEAGLGLWLLSHRKTYVTCEITVSHALIRSRNPHKTISRPLGEECKRNNDAHSAEISRCLEQGNPTNARYYILFKINCRFDFLEFVLHKRVISLWCRLLSILNGIRYTYAFPLAW